MAPISPAVRPKVVPAPAVPPATRTASPRGAGTTIIRDATVTIRAHAPVSGRGEPDVGFVEAALRLAGTRDVGVLVTDAEELGLAGAHAWAAAGAGRGAIVLNCDGVDHRDVE